MNTAPANNARICVGQIVAAHGVRGQVRIKSFTADPLSVTQYGPLSDEAGGRLFKLTRTGTNKGLVLAKVEGVADRNTAETLVGARLFADRSALPEIEEEETFYHADLIGLRAELADGTLVGAVAAIHDFGAGDVLELKPLTGGAIHLPFTKAAVPVVDVKGGRVVIDPPDEIEWRDGPDGDDATVETDSQTEALG